MEAVCEGYDQTKLGAYCLSILVIIVAFMGGYGKVALFQKHICGWTEFS